MALKATQIREMSDDELLAKKQELQKTMMTYRFQKALSQLDKPISLRTARRDYARVLTVMRERSLADKKSSEPSKS